MGIRVEATMDRYGSVLITPISDRWAVKLGRMTKESLGAWRTTAYLQIGFGAEEFLQECTSRQVSDIESGYPIRFVSDWETVLSWFGVG